MLSQNSTEIEFVGLGEWRAAGDCRSAGESLQIWSSFAGRLDQDLLRSSLSRRSGEASVAVKPGVHPEETGREGAGASGP